MAQAMLTYQANNRTKNYHLFLLKSDSLVNIGNTNMGNLYILAILTELPIIGKYGNQKKRKYSRQNNLNVKIMSDFSIYFHYWMKNRKKEIAGVRLVLSLNLLWRHFPQFTNAIIVYIVITKK